MERKMQNKSYPQRRRTPSFSSTLLDTIYHSIDESKSNLDNNDPHLGLFNQTTHDSKDNTKLSYNFNYNHVEKCVRKEKMNLHRHIMIEDWMESKSSKSSHFMNSTTSSSSESVFSSSETDTTHKTRHQKNQQKQKPQREGGFARTKLRAMKIYGELNQKVKQPISPGSRIASFISSIFNNSAGNVKKAKKMCYVGAVEDESFEHKYSISKSSSSPCFSSSASSFSRRSCMSKTPRKSNNNGVKRSVRFYPVSVILGEEDSHPSNFFPLHSNVRNMTRSSSIKEVKNNSKEKSCGFMNGYQNSCKGNNSKFDFRGFYGHGDDEDEDDALSYSSSDLFELDHLIGEAGRYQEELPVYETTNLETNMAIANGLRL